VPELPSGTVTFLASDIEGSTAALRKLRVEYARLLTDHHQILREAFVRHGGAEVHTPGDAVLVPFWRAGDAVRAACDAQRAMAGWR